MKGDSWPWFPRLKIEEQIIEAFKVQAKISLENFHIEINFLILL